MIINVGHMQVQVQQKVNATNKTKRDAYALIVCMHWLFVCCFVVLAACLRSVFRSLSSGSSNERVGTSCTLVTKMIHPSTAVGIKRDI